MVYSGSSPCLYRSPGLDPGTADHTVILYYSNKVLKALGLGGLKIFLFINSNRPVQNRKRGKELNKFCPPNGSDDLCVVFCINPYSVMWEYM